MLLYNLSTMTLSCIRFYLAGRQEGEYCIHKSTFRKVLFISKKYTKNYFKNKERNRVKDES